MNNNSSPTGAKTELEKAIELCDSTLDENLNCCQSWRTIRIAKYALEAAAKHVSEVEKENEKLQVRDTMNHQSLDEFQAALNTSFATIKDLQSKLTTAEKVRNDAVLEMQACHECWNDFTAKVCEVLPDMKRAPLFQQSDVIVAAVKERDELVRKFRAANFPLEQATTCGKCGVYKHTPWRDDSFGYVCATCLMAIASDRFSIKSADVKLMVEALKSCIEHPTSQDQFYNEDKVKLALSTPTAQSFLKQ